MPSGLSRRRRSDAEHDEAEQHGTSPAVQIRVAPACKQERRIGQHIGADHPLQLGKARPERAGDAGSETATMLELSMISEDTSDAVSRTAKRGAPASARTSAVPLMRSARTVWTASSSAGICYEAPDLGEPPAG